MEGLVYSQKAQGSALYNQCQIPDFCKMQSRSGCETLCVVFLNPPKLIYQYLIGHGGDLGHSNK